MMEKKMTERKVRFTNRDTIDGVKDFVSIVSKYKYDVDLVSGRYVIDAKSIMGLFSLDLSSELLLLVHSNDCDDLLNELSNFIV